MIYYHSTPMDENKITFVCHRYILNSCVEKNDEHLNLDMNLEKQMSPTLQVKGF